MTANAAGPIMTVYLVMAGLPKLQMIGTGAWFYLVVNLLKLPLSASLHLIEPANLRLDLTLAPAMLIGAGVVWLLVRRMHQRQFELAALALAALSAGLLLASAWWGAQARDRRGARQRRLRARTAPHHSPPPYARSSSRRPAKAVTGST
jgi:uncharacterized membrane protein YfcA